MHFGRKSEKIDRKIEQLETRLEDLMAEEGEADQAPPAADVVIPRKKPEREPLMAHLPREENVLEPEEQACPECGGKLKLLGEDIPDTRTPLTMMRWRQRVPSLMGVVMATPLAKTI